MCDARKKEMAARNHPHVRSAPPPHPPPPRILHGHYIFLTVFHFFRFLFTHHARQNKRISTPCSLFWMVTSINLPTIVLAEKEVPYDGPSTSRITVARGLVCLKWSLPQFFSFYVQKEYIMELPIRAGEMKINYFPIIGIGLELAKEINFICIWKHSPL